MFVNDKTEIGTSKEVHCMKVYVLNKHGKPLMPCKASKARKLLRDNKAKVVRKTPFTIQLKYGSYCDLLILT